MSLAYETSSRSAWAPFDRLRTGFDKLGTGYAQRSRSPLARWFFDFAADAATLRTNGYRLQANEKRSSHQAIGVTPPPEPRDGVTEQVEKLPPLTLVHEDVFAAIAAGGHMINTPGEFHT
jgi:hypothetical protein